MGSTSGKLELGQGTNLHRNCNEWAHYEHRRPTLFSLKMELVQNPREVIRYCGKSIRTTPCLPNPVTLLIGRRSFALLVQL